MTKFGQIVIGPPGAGKTTYCYGVQQFYNALKRPIAVVNLDPACPEPPYKADVSLTSLITLDDVMQEFGLGPNGGMLYCLEYLEANFDWLVEELAKVKADYVVFDLPGQVELSTDHLSLRNIINRLEKLDYRLAAVHLTDAHHITDASKFVSVLLLALRTMLQLELPHVNILSKIDLLGDYGQLPFNLDFYTEVQDLSYLVDVLEGEQAMSRGKKMTALNKAICGLIEDYGLVGFETLCVEDKQSMFNVMKAIDKAVGYHPASEHNEDDVDFSQLMNPLDEVKTSQAFAAQERWLDQKEVFDNYDRAGWEEEGKIVQEQAK